MTKLFCTTLLIFSYFLTFSQLNWQTAKNLNFEHYVASTYFDVYYLGDNQKQAEIVAKYAEIARAELGQLYDYRPSSRYILLYADDAQRMMQTHLPSRNLPLVSGNISFEKLDEIIIHPEKSAELFNEVKQKVLKLMLKEFDYGIEISNIIQSSLLQYHPKWYTEGMSDYIAKGWNFEDEMWLANISGEEYLVKALTGESEDSKIIRKSIWFYIAHEYGVHKFPEILYITKITHSVESSIIASLGVTLHTFTDRWREWMIKRMEANRKISSTLQGSEVVKKITLPIHSQLLSFAYHEKQQMFALFLEKEGKHELVLYDVQNQKFIPTKFSISQEKNILNKEYPFQYPITWNETGTQLITTFYRQQKLSVAVYELATQQTTHFDLPNTVQRVNSFAWSHDNQQIAASIWQAGKCDVVLFSLKDKTLDFKHITNDYFDDIEPSFSFDDATLYFSSNRDSNDLSFRPRAAYSIGNDFDIFAYHLNDTTQIAANITYTPDINEHKPLQVNSFEVYYLSDESGLWNLFRRNLFQGTHEILTNWQEGIISLQLTEQSMAFISPLAGQLTLFAMKFPETGQGKAKPTTFRSEFLKEWEKQQQNLNNVNTLPDKFENYIEKVDSTLNFVDRDTMKTNKPRYYVYDDEKGSLPPRKTERKADKKAEIPRKKEPKSLYPIPKWDEISITPYHNSQNRWRTDYLRLSLCFNPVPRMGISLGAAFTDMQKNHRLEIEAIPYFNLKNAEGSLKYQYLKLKPDFYVQLKGQNYFYQNWAKNTANTMLNDTILYRYVNLSAKVGLSYPISAYTRFEMSETFHSLDRKDLILMAPPKPAHQSNKLLQSSLKLAHDKVLYVDGSPRKGVSYEVMANHYLSLQQKGYNFSSVRFDIKHYTPVYRKIIWANRLQGTYAFGGKTQHFYVGGIDNMLTGYFFGSRPFSNLRSRGLDTDVTMFGLQEFVLPIRGFGFGGRLGSKYLLINSELRVPLRKSYKGVLNENRLYQFEWFTFSDMGLVWTQALPFSGKEPSDVQTITNPAVTVNLQTIRDPYILSLGTGVKAYFLAHVIRAEVAAGLDDGRWQTIMLSFALGRNF
ncbi:MAG: hypothetical protein ACKVTZ_02255 [Bacteroidia bacterium]